MLIADLELNVKLGKVLEATRANLLGILGTRTNVPLEAHVLGRAELVGTVPRDIHPARLARVAIALGCGIRNLKLGEVGLLKVGLRGIGRRHSLNCALGFRKRSTNAKFA